jgi:hypothetical protein
VLSRSNWRERSPNCLWQRRRQAIDRATAPTSIFTNRSEVEFHGIAFLSWGKYENEAMPSRFRTALGGGRPSGTAQSKSSATIRAKVSSLLLMRVASVRLYGQECDDRIDIALLDNIAALRSLKLVEDVVVNMVDLLHRLPRRSQSCFLTSQ